MPSISLECPHCQKFESCEVHGNEELFCPHCSRKWGEVTAVEQIFDSCPVCLCQQFYIQKDFNQALGCLIVLIGIVLVPKTYGLSLPVVALIDWVIYHRLATICVCYQCGAEFRGFTVPKNFKKFMHHIGVKYDRKKEVKNGTTLQK